MKVKAEIYAVNDFSGYTYLHESYPLEQSNKDTFYLNDYRNHYIDVVETLRSKHLEDIVMNDLRKCYFEILIDSSFKERTEYYCQFHNSVNKGLIAFYETELLPTLTPSISKEMLGILSLLSNEKPQRHNLPERPILISNDVTLSEWFTFNIQDLLGIVLINNSISSHTAQIAISLKIPMAIITTKKPGLYLLEDKFVFCSVEGKFVSLETK